MYGSDHFANGPHLNIVKLHLNTLDHLQGDTSHNRASYVIGTPIKFDDGHMAYLPIYTHDNR